MFALWTKRSIVHGLVFVRLPHDRRFVGAVLFLFLFVLVLFLFVFIRISGRHRVAHDHEGTPVDQPGGKFLGDVWGHVVAPRACFLVRPMSALVGARFCLGTSLFFRRRGVTLKSMAARPVTGLSVSSLAGSSVACRS